ncbi:MAG: formylglycine-generating enzyme family protein [Treponema sp.]|jgi:formylglycine-generating enzyme required for sulfatase activity/TolB-like protein|nr:formylglycine-generating enzyme family protein [Treponema sp.]
MLKRYALLLLLLVLAIDLYGAGEVDSTSRRSRQPGTESTSADASIDSLQEPETAAAQTDSNTLSESPVVSETVSSVSSSDTASSSETVSSTRDASKTDSASNRTDSQEQEVQSSSESAEAAAYTGTSRLLILPFIGVSKAEGESAALFISNISELNTVFKVLNPRILSQEPSLANYQVPPADITDQGILSIGKKYNAEYVLAGQLTRLGEHQMLILTLVNVSTGQLVAGGYREIREIADIHLFLPALVRKIVHVAELDVENAPNLGISPFSIPSIGISSQDVNILTQFLIIEIANSGKYKVLRRLSGDRKTPDIKTLGNMLGSPYVLIENVVQIGESAYFVAQIIETRDNALHRGSEIQYRDIRDGMRLMSELAYELTEIREGGMPSIFVPENMVWVAGGSFAMGNRVYDGDEKPVHTVQLNSFFMSKTQVTQEEYQAVMGTNPSGFVNRSAPVERVTWYEAVEYCNKLSRKEGLIPAYYGTNDQIYCDFSATGYRLPTEAEWEYAARGGNWDTLSFDRSGGNEANPVAWYVGNSGGTTHSVGTKKPNSLGLYDMAGNVWEWCWDWYGPYEDRSQYNPRGPAAGTDRIVRGGSWNSNDAWLRSTYRNRGDPAKQYRDVGFRVVRPNF